MIFNQHQADAAVQRLVSYYNAPPQDAQSLVAEALGYHSWEALSGALTSPPGSHEQPDFAYEAMKRFYASKKHPHTAHFNSVFFPHTPAPASDVAGLSPTDAIRKLARLVEPFALFRALDDHPTSTDQAARQRTARKRRSTHGSIERAGLRFSYDIQYPTLCESKEMEVIEWSVTARRAGRVVAMARGDAYTALGRAPTVDLWDAVRAADMISDVDVSNIRALYKSGQPVQRNMGITTLRYLHVPPADRGSRLSITTLAFIAEKLRDFRHSIGLFVYDPDELIAALPFPDGFTLGQGPNRDIAFQLLMERFESPLSEALKILGVKISHAPLADKLNPNQAMYAISFGLTAEQLFGELPENHYKGTTLSVIHPIKKP